jgi:amino acid adenylation domain-containing protein/thioester reductase-like protein
VTALEDNVIYYPLTHPQKGIWYTEKLYPGTSIGNIAGTLKIKGKVNFCLLKKACEIFIKKNDSLRLQFREIDGEPYQYISKYSYSPVSIFDFSCSSLQDLYNWDIKQSQTPFNLIDAPLFYCALIKMNENESGLYLCMHHLISDAWTIVISTNKILKLYNKLVSNQNIDEELEPSYIEYIKSEKEYLNSSKYVKDREFWGSKMEELPDVVTLKNHSLVGINTKTKRKTFVVPSKLSAQINAYCNEKRVSVFSLFISALNIYIYRTTGRNDLIFGVPVLNRANAREKQTLGMFVSIVPLRIKMDIESSFNILSEIVTNEWLSVLRHQKYPYDDIIKNSREKNGNIERLYDIALSYQNARVEKSEDFDYQESRWHSNGHQTESLFIHINNRDDLGNIILDFDFLQDIFSTKEVEFIYDHMLRILWHAIDNPVNRISKIEMISEKEKQKIVFDFNKTAMEYPSDKTLSMLFEEQAIKSPDSIAVVFENENLTYHELNERANQLAHRLRTIGVGSDTIVSIMLRRSLEIIISILAVFKAGGAYLPIDPELPQDRIQYMLDDSSSVALITDPVVIQEFKYKGQIVNINDTALFLEGNTNLPSINRSSDLAYIIYTSGSTGKPKAAMIEHKSVVNFAYSVRELLDYSHGNVVLCVTTMCFDIFIFEVFPTLIFGLKLVIANEKEQKFPELLSILIKKNKITKIMTTPSRMQLLAFGQKEMSCFSCINEIILGGEPFPNKLLGKLKEVTNAKIFNMYGPTETTVYSTIKELTNVKNINIGKPIGNTQIYILDKNNNIVPIGTQGEICIGGHGLARGYFHRADITSEKFVPNPLNPTEKIYKTGDLGRWFPQGEIECRGRMDFQIKIRGFRIELGEIESQLMQYPGIEDAVVIDRIDIESRKYLCAYLVLKHNYDIDTADLKAFLGNRLPLYMIPSFFIKIDMIPLNRNGKVNRLELPEPKLKIEGRLIQPPRNDIEKILLSKWCKILNRNINEIGIDDNLFDFGADSLAVISFQTAIAEYNWNLTTQDFYKHPTIRELSANILGLINTESEHDNQTELYPRDVRFYNKKSKMGKKIQFKNVLLTGVTGFLGMHILDYILSNTDASIYCIVRQKQEEDIIDRFKKNDKFYFNGRYNNLINERIFLLKGDVSLHQFGLNSEEYKYLGSKIDTVINSAANVKYYGNYTDSYNINVLGVKQCAEFCFAYGIQLNHISTLGVCGHYLVKQNKAEARFTENDLFFGQNFTDNIYVRSKLEAESLINNYMKKGLTATIFRVGNLTGRFSDGNFQHNVEDNAFVNLVNSIVNVGLLPENLLHHKLEFTPVDLCSKAIIELLKYNECKNKVFHIFNHNVITAHKFISYMNDNGYNIRTADASLFKKYIEEILAAGKRNILSGLINDLNSRFELQFKSVVNISSDVTLHYLNQIGFSWPQIDANYLLKFLSILKTKKAVSA